MKLVAKASKPVGVFPPFIEANSRHLCFLVRFSIKDLNKAYDKTEDDIKAVQSVGQIIGEVMKQLDSDRCTPMVFPTIVVYTNTFRSHCESILGSAIRCLLPPNPTSRKAEDGNACLP